MTRQDPPAAGCVSRWGSACSRSARPFALRLPSARLRPSPQARPFPTRSRWRCRRTRPRRPSTRRRPARRPCSSLIAQLEAPPLTLAEIQNASTLLHDGPNATCHAVGPVSGPVGLERLRQPDRDDHRGQRHHVVGSERRDPHRRGERHRPEHRRRDDLRRRGRRLPSRSPLHRRPARR